ncbi:MAG TPA: hypothetical protein DEA08_27490, partial [Planctomycetes bacterium]|nr:hypothetical protein [Planctomycetota bacterium]
MTSQRSSTPAASDVLSPLLLARARAAAPPPLVSAALHQLRRSLHEARAWRAVVVEPGLVRVCPRSPRRRARGEGEPVSLWSLRPLRASCGCLEFAHLRLGICAHVGAALRALAARPRQLERALARAQPPPRGPELRWLPLLPSAEAEPDGLARVRLHLGRDRRRNRHCATLVERWLEPTDEPRVLRPRAGALASPPARSGLVHALARALRVNARRSAAREGARSPRRDWLPQRDSLPLRDWALERLLADELHRLVQVTTQARSDARAARFGALPAAARDFLAAGHAAFERADEAARRCARAAARRLWRTGHVGRSLVVAPESRLV